MWTDMSTPIDRRVLSERLAGNTEMIRDTIRRALAECLKQLSAISIAIDTGDSQRVRTSAHALKRTAAALAATLVVDAAWALESLARRGDLAHARLVWLRVDTEAARLMAALRVWEVELESDAVEVV